MTPKNIIPEIVTKLDRYFENVKHKTSIRLRSDYSFGYNSKFKNKLCSDKREFSNFTSLSGSPIDLKDIINNGKAFSPSVFQRSQRSANNFIKCDILSIDIDNSITRPKLDEQGNIVKDENGNPINETVYDEKLTLEDAQNNPFIKLYGVIYTSPSHKPEWHKFRIVFFLPFPLDNAELVKQCLRDIDLILGGDVIDRACIDVARLFYGNDQAIWYNFDECHQLPIEFIERAKENLAKSKEVNKAKRDARKESEYKCSNDELYQHIEAIRDISPYSKGGGTYPIRLSYVWGICSLSDDEDFREALIDVLESVSFFAHGDSQKVVRDFDNNRNEHSIASVIYAYKALTGNDYPIKVYSKSEYDKVILSGGEALDRAKSSVTQDDLKEHSVITENEFKIAIDNEDYSKFQAELIRQYNGLSRSFKKGFGNRSIEIPDLHIREIVVNFDTFFSLQKSDVQDKVRIIIPKKYCEPTLRAKIINHLRKIEVKYLLDRTQTGGGKSSTISKLFDILYLDTNYKNPSNPDLKEAPYLTPRTEHGLYMVKGEIKADPSKEIRALADDPSEANYLKIKDGNCHLKPVFLALQNKGYGNADNLPCQKCDRQKTCSLTPNGYKYETRNDIANMIKYRQGRFHPYQLTDKLIEKLISIFPDLGLAWEEVGTLKPVNELEFTESDLTYLIAKLAIANEEIISIEKRDKLIKVLSYLKSIIDPAMGKTLIPTQEGNNKFYGLNNAQIMKNLPSVPELNLDEYGSLMDFINPLNDLPSANIETKEVNPHYVSKEYITRKRKEEKELKARSVMELIAEAQNISPNADKLLDAFLEPSDQISLSSQLSTNKGKWVLGVSSFNDTWSRLAKLAKFNLFMDATITPTQVRALFNIPDDEPLVIIENEKISLNNLQVFKIDVKGLGSNDWSQESIDRAKEAVSLIRRQNPDKNIAVMTLKKYAEALNTPYWYGKHDRGTNELMDYDAIIFIGTPFINVGAVQREYEVLFGGRKDKPTFEQFYNQKIYEFRIQGLGRSRAQYKSKIIHQFYVTTNEDLSYVKELGVEYKEISGEAISPLLSTKGDRTVFKIHKEALSLIKNGIKATCQAVADSLNMTKQGVSKAVKGLGLSWRDFVSCQLRLLEIYKGKVDKIMNVHWSEYHLKENPQELIKMSIDNIVKNGIEGLFEMIEGLEMPYHIASRFLWIISPLFDDRLGKIPMILSET